MPFGPYSKPRKHDRAKHTKQMYSLFKFITGHFGDPWSVCVHVFIQTKYTSWKAILLKRLMMSICPEFGITWKISRKKK